MHRNRGVADGASGVCARVPDLDSVVHAAIEAELRVALAATPSPGATARHLALITKVAEAVRARDTFAAGSLTL